MVSFGALSSDQKSAIGSLEIAAYPWDEFLELVSPTIPVPISVAGLFNRCVSGSTGLLVFEKNQDHIFAQKQCLHILELFEYIGVSLSAMPFT